VRRLAITVMVRVLKAAGDAEAAAQWEQQLGENPPDKQVIRPGAAIPLQDSPE
jgi:Tfp pilus assembly protein PilF